MPKPRINVFSAGKRPRVHGEKVSLKIARPRLCLRIPDKLIAIIGTITKVVVYKQDTGFSIFYVNTPYGEIICVGNLKFRLEEGWEVEISAEKKQDARYGVQFKISALKLIELTSAVGIKNYLSTGIISGIGPALADRIVATFGGDTLDVLDDDPQRLLEVKGIAPKTFSRIADSWKKKRAGARVIAELCKHSLSISEAQKTYKEYGENALAIVRENPYRLADEVHGIGFAKADRIANGFGMELNSPFRLRAGILSAIKNAEAAGHCCLPLEELKARAVALLGVECHEIDNSCIALCADGKLTAAYINSGENIEPWLWLTQMYDAERSIEKRLSDLKTQSVLSASINVKEGMSAEQRNAVLTALTSGISIITGSAGTGKTTALSELVRCIEQQKIPYFLAAPTGRAAKRISEVTNRPASTIHRLLIDMRRKLGDPNRVVMPANAYIILDEFSMVDAYLLDSLLGSVPKSVRLVLIGDPFQLEPVSAGRALRDLIDSARFPVTRLQAIYRQKDTSSIISIANDIKNGRIPDLQNKPDAFFFEIRDSAHIAEIIVDVATRRIPEKFGIPFRDVMLLSPMRRGILGVDNLNRLFQEKIQSPGSTTLQGLKKGDKIINRKNDYGRGIFNGDTGIVTNIDLDTNVLSAHFEGIDGEFEYELSEMDRLDLAYVTTIHRSQSGQAPCVIVIMDCSHSIMLSNSLLYTAATRARNLLVFVGQRKALAIAVKNNSEERRHTSLFKQMRPHPWSSPLP